MSVRYKIGRFLLVGVTMLLSAPLYSHTAFSQSPEWVVFSDTPSARSSVIDRYDRVWMGGTQLALYDGKSWSYFDYQNSPMPLGTVTDLTLDQSGNVWVSVANEHLGGGLVKIEDLDGQLDPGDWTVYFHDSYLTHVTADSSEYVWQASLEPKLGHPYPVLRFDGQNWEENDPENDSLAYRGPFEPDRIGGL